MPWHGNLPPQEVHPSIQSNLFPRGPLSPLIVSERWHSGPCRQFVGFTFTGILGPFLAHPDSNSRAWARPNRSQNSYLFPGFCQQTRAKMLPTRIAICGPHKILHDYCCAMTVVAVLCCPRNWHWSSYGCNSRMLSTQLLPESWNLESRNIRQYEGRRTGAAVILGSNGCIRTALKLTKTQILESLRHRRSRPILLPPHPSTYLFRSICLFTESRK